MNRGIYYLYYSILFTWIALSEASGQEQVKYSFSETTVKGIITDEKGVPMPYATISVSYPSSPAQPVKGTITTQKGSFQLKLSSGKDFLISARFMGYRDTVCRIQTNGVTIDLGHLALNTQSQQLEQVTVKPAITVNADRITYNFEHDKDRATSNLMTMIQKMPLILVDDFTGKIYVEAQNKTYIVLRNGRVDALFSNSTVSFDQMLEKLPAMGFTQFEIWQQPPPRYQQYDYVINIITDKSQRLFGAVGSTYAHHDFNAGFTTLQQGFTGSADRLRFTGGFNFNNNHSPSHEKITHTQYFATEKQPAIYIDQEEWHQRKGQNYIGRVKLSYDLSKKQFINFDAEYTRNNTGNKYQLYTDSSTIDTKTRFNHYTSEKKQNTNWKLGATYQYDFINNSRILNLSYLFDTQSPLNRQEITETAEWEVDRNNKTSKLQNIENLIHKFQIDYTDNFSHSKFTLDLGLGYLIQNYDDRSHAYDLILQQSDESLYAAMQQNLHRIDAYAELKWNPTNQLSLTGKIIADYLPNHNKIRLSYTDYTEDITQHGVLYSPQLKIRYMFDTPTPNRDVDYMESLSLKSTLDISYQQTRSRPAPRQMSTYSDVSNPNWIEKGNPNLQPELFHQFSAVLNMGLPHNVRFSSSIGHFRSKNKIISYSFFETDATQNRLVKSFINAKLHSWRTNFNVTYKLKLIFRGMFNKQFLNIPNEKSSSSILSFSGTYNFDALKFIRIGIKLNYDKYFNDGARGFTTTRPLSLSFMLTPKRFKIGDNYLSTSLAVNDVLNWEKSKNRQFVYTQHSETESTTYTRKLPITLNISYSFGKFKSKPLKSARKKASVEGFSTEQ